MAKIVYGVMGDALGHVNRALVIARQMPEHRFLFVGGGKVLGLRSKGFEVFQTPVLGTSYKNNRVDLLRTSTGGIKTLVNSPRNISRVAGAIGRFGADIAFSDYEFFTPLAAGRSGIPCISIDHQHVVSRCRVPVASGQFLSRLLFSFPHHLIHSNSARYMITSFFEAVPRDSNNTELFPPVLPPSLKTHSTGSKEHVLVYQTSRTFKALLPALRQIPGPCFIYGLGSHSSCGNLKFKANSKESFIEDLAFCRYLITNGGHNAISEALYFGKPVFCFPIGLAYEQYVNAYMVSHLGYGDYCVSRRPDPGLLNRFEKNLDSYRSNIRGKEFYGTDQLVNRLNRLASRSKPMSNTKVVPWDP